MEKGLGPKELRARQKRDTYDVMRGLASGMCVSMLGISVRACDMAGLREVRDYHGKGRVAVAQLVVVVEADVEDGRVYATRHWTGPSPPELTRSLGLAEGWKDRGPAGRLVGWMGASRSCACLGGQGGRGGGACSGRRDDVQNATRQPAT